MNQQHRQAVEQLSKELTDSGKLIEAGFAALRVTCMHPDAPADQVHEMRLAFMAGAQHLFSSIMTILDPGHEPSAKDLQRMALIQKELDDFGRDLTLRFTPTKGKA